MQKVLIESTATVTGSKISGVALTPTTSRNGNNYLPDVIDSAKNVNVLLDNLNWEHTNEKVGTVKFTVDPNSHTMYYEGNILSERRNQIKEGTHKVSIEAHVDEVARTCSPKTCYNTPMTLTMEGLAITSNPSVQTTSLVLESSEALNQLAESLVKQEEIIKENEKIEQLENQIKTLERKLDHALTCKKCGGVKKN